MITDKISDKLHETVEMENKQTHSDKIYNTISIVASIVLAVTALTFFIMYFCDKNLGVTVFMIAFYPLVLIMIASTFICVKELLRNRYLSTMIALALITLALALTLAVSIMQIVDFGKFFILPMNFPKKLVDTNSLALSLKMLF